MGDGIYQRIANEVGTDLIALLSESLSGSDLHSVLLSTMKQRVAKLDVSKLGSAAATVTGRCDLDGRLINRIERIALEAASNFNAVELSPVNPLGSVSVLTGLDQANVLSTIRAMECASDPTIGLALDCAQKRKSAKQRKITNKVCTNQRVLRFPIPTNPEYKAHFKLFALLTAGRDSGSFEFEVAAMREHIDTYLRFLYRLKDEGFTFEEIAVELSETRSVAELCSLYKINKEQIKTLVRARDSSSSAKLLEQYERIWPETMANPAMELASYGLPTHLILHLNSLAQKVCAPLKEEHPSVKFSFNMHRLTGLGYYAGPCFHLKVKNASGQTFMIGDGGTVDWTQKLLSDSKERLMTSAVGTELLCRMFR